MAAFILFTTEDITNNFNTDLHVKIVDGRRLQQMCQMRL